MPNEKVPTFLFATDAMPDELEDLVDSAPAGSDWTWPGRAGDCGGAARVDGLGVEERADLAQRILSSA